MRTVSKQQIAVLMIQKVGQAVQLNTESRRSAVAELDSLNFRGGKCLADTSVL